MTKTCFTPFELAQFFLTPERLDFFCQHALATTPENRIENFPQYLFLFALTCVLELPVYFLAFKNNSILKRVGILFALNLATHPIVCFVWPAVVAFFNGTTATAIVLSECFAFSFEALLCWKWFGLSVQKSCLISIVTNLCSWVIGLWVMSLIF